MKKHDINQVISVGESLFREYGYFNTGTEDILKKSEYPRSSFYYHFKSKEGFALKVIENYGQKMEQYYASILLDKEEKSPRLRLNNFTDSIISFAEKGEFKTECLIQKFSIECASINEMIRTKAKDQLNKVLKVLQKCIHDGQNMNEFRNDKSALELSKMYQSSLYGAFILSRLQKDAQAMIDCMEMTMNYLDKKSELTLNDFDP